VYVKKQKSMQFRWLYWMLDTGHWTLDAGSYLLDDRAAHLPLPPPEGDKIFLSGKGALSLKETCCDENLDLPSPMQFVPLRRGIRFFYQGRGPSV